MKDAAIVRIESTFVEEETLLYYNAMRSANCPFFLMTTIYISNVHLLKLVIGVDISTLPVKRSGNAGNATASRMRRRAAEEKRSVLGWSW